MATRKPNTPTTSTYQRFAAKASSEDIREQDTQETYTWTTNLMTMMEILPFDVALVTFDILIDAIDH